VVPPADVGFFGLTVSRDGNDLYYAVKQNLDKGTLYRVQIFGGTPAKLLEWIDGPVTFEASKQCKYNSTNAAQIPNREL